MKIEAAPPVRDVASVDSFEGFTPEDFAVFEIEGFAARMPALRARIKPKLTRVGQILAGSLSDTLGEPLHPHVAQHLRRTVNAPVETWVAFSRSPRAYKPFVHLRCAVSEHVVRLTVFVEDYADDKQLFANNLRRNAIPLARHFARNAAVLAYEIPDAGGLPKRGKALDAATLTGFADRMERVKGQHAVFGLAFARTHPVVGAGPELLEAVVAAAHTLKPLYDCGRPAPAKPARKTTRKKETEQI